MTYNACVTSTGAFAELFDAMAHDDLERLCDFNSQLRFNGMLEFFLVRFGQVAAIFFGLVELRQFCLVWFG